MGLAAAGATLFGGVIALRLQGAQRSLLAFGGGVVLAVALLDLMPEALALGAPAPGVPALLLIGAAGFTAYLALGALAGGNDVRTAGRPSRLGLAGLVLHSVVDGLGVGSAFQAGASIGWLVALGVVAHDVADGSNTVAFSRASQISQRATLGWLAFDALAPALGLILSTVLAPRREGLAVVLAAMAGGFLYLGANVLAPLLRSTARIRMMALAGLGGLFILVLSRLGHG